MNIKFKTMKFVISLLLVGFSLTALSAQVSSDEKNWFRYCIGVKGWFTSDGKCYTGRNPKFESLKLELRKDEEAIEEKGELNMSDLDSGTYFDYDLKGSSDLGTNFDSAVDDATKFKLHYNLWVTEIKNDTHIQSSFFTKEGEKARLIPLTPIEEIGASDPCSNNFNWSGNREWYKLKLDVIVDNPVPLEHAKEVLELGWEQLFIPVLTYTQLMELLCIQFYKELLLI